MSRVNLHSPLLVSLRLETVKPAVFKRCCSPGPGWHLSTGESGIPRETNSFFKDCLKNQLLSFEGSNTVWSGSCLKAPHCPYWWEMELPFSYHLAFVLPLSPRECRQLQSCEAPWADAGLEMWGGRSFSFSGPSSRKFCLIKKPQGPDGCRMLEA